MDAQRFLALEKPLGRNRPFGPFESSTVGRAQRIAIQNLAGEALNEVRAPWPGSLESIRRDLQLLHLAERQEPSIVASFLHQDLLDTSRPSEDSYSLLVVGEAAGNRWERTFTWYRPVREGGKGAPRFFSQLDWDEDGSTEVLLEVFGAEARWWAALSREGGRWTVHFQDPCGVPGAGEEER
jgi:hypothetical protein